jgi:hypothetical protein
MATRLDSYFIAEKIRRTHKDLFPVVLPVYSLNEWRSGFPIRRRGRVGVKCVPMSFSVLHSRLRPAPFPPASEMLQLEDPPLVFLNNEI